MIVHFLDRNYHQVGTASTDDNGNDIRISDVSDGEFKSVDGGYTSYKADICYTPEQSALVQEMATAGQFILYKDRNGNPMWMEINDFNHDPGILTDTITAEGASMDLLNETVGAYAADKAYPIAEYIHRFISDSGYEIGVNEIPDLTRKLSWEGIGDTALTRILSVATQFGVELDFDFDIDGLNVLHRYINIRKQIGGDRAVKLYQNVNLNDVRTEVNKDDLCTSIYGTGATPEGEDAPINLVGYKWTDPDGRFVLGGDGILRDTVAVQTWSRLRNANDPAPTRSHIQRVMTYEAQTQAQLLQSVLSDIKKYNHPTVTYEADIAVLPDGVDIGDTIGLVDEGESLYLSARVLELNYSYSLESGTATLGDYLVQTDQVDPAYRELAEALAKQNKGKDGVGLESSVVAYQAWTSGTTAPTGTWSEAVPTVSPSQFLWSRTVLTMTDGSSSTTYSVGKMGDTGKAGNGIQSSIVTYQVGTSGTTAPTGTWSSTIPAASQGTYLWSKLLTTYTDGTQNTAYSVAYQGTNGAKGDPGSQDVPMTYVQAAQPTGKIVKDSTWWVGDTMSSVTALKRWNGSSWIPETISQDVLNVVSLNAVNITGSTISGSKFVSSFSGVQPNGATFTVKGTSTLENGALSTLAYKDSDNSLYSTTNVSPVDIGSVMYDRGTKFDEIRLREGQLYMGGLYKDSASSDPYWQDGVITPAQLLMMQRCGSVLWTGTNFMNGVQTITPYIPINKCLTGWLLTWQEYINGAVTGRGIVNTPLYKNDVIAHSGVGFPLGFVNYEQNAVVKYVYPTTTQIKGNDRNSSLDYSKGFVLKKVTAF